MCTRPNRIFIGRFGERRMARSDSTSYQFHDGFVSFEYIDVPCQHCVQCRLEKKSQDAFRCMKDVECYDKNIMITLTYNDEHLPYGEPVKINEETGEVTRYPTLRKEDYQKFKKRLRKAVFPLKIKTFDCGEYGDEKGRPHYHAILMNYNPGDLVFWKYSICEWNPSVKNKLYRSATLDKLWTDPKTGESLGFIEINEVNYETCAYVAGYIEKKYSGELAKKEYEDKGIIPPYTTRSKNLGLNYFLEHKEDFYNEKKTFIQTSKKLQEIKPGRYFDKLMEKYDPERYATLKERRKEKAQEIMAEVLRKTSLSEQEYKAQLDRQFQKRFDRVVTRRF